MSSQLQINKLLQDNSWVITAEVLPGGVLPQNIFVYENSGTTELGNFYGTASVEDLTRMQIWSGVAIPIFGNKFVLSDNVKIIVDPASDPDTVISMLVTTVSLLSKNLQIAASSTQIVNIL